MFSDCQKIKLTVVDLIPDDIVTHLPQPSAPGAP